MKIILLLLPILAFAFPGSDDRTIDADFINPLNQTTVTVSAPLTVTGLTTLETSLTGFLKATSGVVSAQALIDLTTDVTGVLPVANGGTNSSTALANNFVMISSGGAIVESAITTTTLGFLDATSSIQTQIDSKMTDPMTTNGDIIFENSGPQRLGIGTDDQVLTLVSGLPSWEDATGGAGGSGSGAKTFILGDDSNLEETTGLWLAYDDAGTLVDGTGGSPSTTCTRNTSSPLVGVADLLLTKPASDESGSGCSLDFTITDNTYVDAPQYHYARFRFKTSADYGAGDISIEMYNKDGTALITNVISSVNKELPAGESEFIIGFQTAAGDNDYRLIFNILSTNALAYTVQFDEILFGPIAQAIGPAVTDKQPLTISGSWTTNTTYEAFWQQDGENVIIDVNVVLSGAPNSSNLTLTLPIEFPVDTSKIPSSVNFATHIGTASILNSGTKVFIGGAQLASGSTTANIYTADGGSDGAVDQASPFTFANNDQVSIRLKYPVVGWSSNVQYSQAFSNVDVYIDSRSNNNTALTANVTPIDWTEVEDSIGSWNGTEFTAKKDEVVYFDGHVSFDSSVSGFIELYIDGTLKQRCSNISANSFNMHLNCSAKMSVGEVASFRSTVSEGLDDSTEPSVRHYLTITNKGTNQSLLDNPGKTLNSWAQTNKLPIATEHCKVEASTGTPVKDNELCDTWVDSISDDGVGSFTLTITTGTFDSSAELVCTCVAAGNADCSPTSTTIIPPNISFRTRSNTTLLDNRAWITCTGKK